MLAPLLQEQLDFLLFVSGLSFVLLAVTCTNLRRQPAQRLPWAWLGLFGVTQGLDEWLEVLALSTGDGPAFAAIRMGIMALSFLCLLEFGRSGGRRLGRTDPGVWIYLPLALAAAIGGTAGVPGLNAAARYAFGLVGGIWAAVTLWHVSQRESETRGVLRIMALLMAGYALAAAAFVPPAPFFPASTINPAAFQALTGIPLQLIRAALALFLAAALWDFYAQRLAKPLRADRRQHGLQFTAAMAFILIAGWFFTNAVENKTVRRGDQCRSARAPHRFEGRHGASRICPPARAIGVHGPDESADPRFVSDVLARGAHCLCGGFRGGRQFRLCRSRGAL